MPLEPFLPVLLATMVLSIFAMVWAVGEQAFVVSAIAVALFALVIGLLAFRSNVPFWRGQNQRRPGQLVLAARNNAWLMVLTYGWGAVAMLAIYSLTNIWWWHSWQYGLMMAVLALFLIGFVVLLGSEKRLWFRSPRVLDLTAWLSVLQAVSAIAALAYLFQSGKLLRQGNDWPANHIFVAGGLAIILISVIAVLTHWHLRRARSIT